MTRPGSPCSCATTGSTSTDPAIARLVADRTDDPLFRSLAVRTAEGHLSFVYKAAAEIGELGDNTRALRAAVQGDDLLRLALAGDTAAATVLGHTRWASVGIISQPNAHPLDSVEVDRPDGPYVTAALNGDVDNFADLKAADGLRLAAEITTDAKVIPTLVSRRLAEGRDLTDAFRDTVAGFEGSVAIAASAAARPDHLLLALRGSGQALYVGLADGGYVVASEPYGVVELTDTYLRMDGETPADPDNPTASRGQIVVLDGAHGGHARGHHPAGLRRHARCRSPRPTCTTPRSPRGTSTDGDFPHFLLKEITEAPISFRKTLRGKLVERDGRLEVVLGPDVLPDDVRDDLRVGSIDRIQVIGQGTAHVAGQSLAAALDAALPTGAALRVEALPATELSGFGLRPDMRDTLVIAISQSGTTTDTNRTVDLARTRGARVLAIVNRRQSDLTDKSDGVLYTSDGRDVEMSVASTKAFYAQIAAGFLLAWTIAAEVGGAVEPALVRALRDLPVALAATVARRAGHRGGRPAARPVQALLGHRRQRHQPHRGRGAADQAQRALLQGHRLRRHRGQEAHRPVLRAADPRVRGGPRRLDGGRRGQGGGDLPRPQGHADRDRQRRRGPVRRRAAGHRRARRRTHSSPSCWRRWPGTSSATRPPLPSMHRPAPCGRRVRRSRTLSASPSPPTATHSSGPCGRRSRRPARSSSTACAAGVYDGHLEASTAVRLASSFRYAVGIAPLDAYQAEHGRIGTPPSSSRTSPPRFTRASTS